MNLCSLGVNTVIAILFIGEVNPFAPQLDSVLNSDRG